MTMYALWAKRSRRAAVRVGAPNNCVRSAKPEVGHLDELVDETCVVTTDAPRTALKMRLSQVSYYPAPRDRKFPGILEVSWIPGKVFVFLPMLSSLPPVTPPWRGNGRETKFCFFVGASVRHKELCRDSTAYFDLDRPVFVPASFG